MKGIETERTRIVRNAKNRAWKMFDEGYNITETSEAVALHYSTVSKVYGEWLQDQIKRKARKAQLQELREPYWKTEEELEKSFNLQYDYDSLSDDEKEIYQKL